MSNWTATIRRHGTSDVDIIFPRGTIDRHSTVVASICELAQPQGQPLDFPFQGNATMAVCNIVPRDDGIVSVRISIDWDCDLNARLHFVVNP
jgi:hypothetical protein